MHTYRCIGCAISLWALSGGAAAGPSGFDHFISFGDSLSDNGNVSSLLFPAGPTMRFTTNPGKVAVELVASHYGFHLQPSTRGGSDYAWGGARADADIPVLGTLSLPSTATQLSQYLAANQGHADGHALYTYWIGANDLFSALQGNPDTAQATAATIGASVAGQIGTLQHAGARYIVVFNLPDLGKTPSYLGSSQAAQATALTQTYNQQLAQGLSQHPQGVIPINVYALLNQVIADPARYGFSQVSHPACTTSSSILCSASTLVSPQAASSYLFADGVHPSTAAHAMLAEAVLSELAAPAQISLLSEAPMAQIQAQNRVIANQMLEDHFGAATRAFAAIDYGEQHFTSIGAPAAVSHNGHLSLGTDARISDQVSVGLALGVGQGQASLGTAGGWRLRDVSGSGYASYHAGGGYVGLYAHVGQSNFGQIDRRFAIGANLTSETGHTQGSHVGAGLLGGWLFGGPGIKTGPTAGIEWDAIHIDGYRESGQDATAMWFAGQQRLALISHLGWRLQGAVQASTIQLQPFAEFSWNHDSRTRADPVTAGLNTMPGYFTLGGYLPDANWWTGSAGLSAWFTPRLRAWLGYSGRFGDQSQRLNSYNLGLKFTL